MPQYLFLIYDDQAAWDGATDADWKAEMDRHNAFSSAVKQSGATVVGGDALGDTSTATTVRPRLQQAPLVTDGPFAETKEVLGGYYLMECRDAEQALELAKQCPNYGSLEVRPTFVVPA